MEEEKKTQHRKKAVNLVEHLAKRKQPGFTEGSKLKTGNFSWSLRYSKTSQKNATPELFILAEGETT